MDTASPEIPPAAPARADETGQTRPRLKLHIPPHGPAPGEPPDFSYVPQFPAGAVERPDIAVPAEQTHPLAYKLIRVLDRVTPVSDHVKVDAELRGCPISPEQLREFLAAVLVGRRPQLPDEAVCLECKRRGYPCVIVSAGLSCLGPVTKAGCGAICPGFARGCYGCFGPREQPNVISLSARFEQDGLSTAEAGRRFAGFTAWAEPFRAAIPADGPPRPPLGRPGEATDARR